MKCKICERECKNLTSLGGHISKKHKPLISIKKYYDEYLKKDINDGLCFLCKKETKFLGLQGYNKYCCIKCFSNDPDTKINLKQIFINKFGVDCPFRNEEIKNKSKQTCIRKYGVDNPSKVQSIREKVIQTCIRKYGVDAPSKIKGHQEKVIQTCIKKYGMISYNQTNKSRETSRLGFLNRIEYFISKGFNIQDILTGKEESVFINELKNICKYEIITQKYINGYFVDGYIEQFKLIIEFDEYEHFSYLGKIRDEKRQNNILSQDSYIFYRISHKIWKNRKEEILNNFKLLIQELEYIKEENNKNV